LASDGARLLARAGISQGSRVLDAGAGPGYATVDLAEIVGPAGEVIAVERSQRFVEAAREASRSRGLENVRVHELDLMSDPLPADAMDAAWCRWVASFVAFRATLIAKLAAAIRPAESPSSTKYIDYGAWASRAREALDRGVRPARHGQLARSRRRAGHRARPADVARRHGLPSREAVPRTFCVHPGDPLWQWPASFIDVNLKRLLELGRVSESWAGSVRREPRRAGGRMGSA